MHDFMAAPITMPHRKPACAYLLTGSVSAFQGTHNFLKRKNPSHMANLQISVLQNSMSYEEPKGAGKITS